MTALAEDHWNDVMSNMAAVAGAITAYYWPPGWWVDAGVAIFFSLIIFRNWVLIVMEQVGARALQRSAAASARRAG